MHKLRSRFISGLEPTQIDHTNENRYYSRQQILLNAKRQIGDLSMRIETEWHITNFGSVDKVGVQIFSEIKQVINKYI